MQHEVGSACLDKVDNDWDHSVDCDDDDCAPVRTARLGSMTW